MYFDAVLDANMRPLFNGTTQETKEWLGRNSADARIDSVCIGKTMQVVSVREYFELTRNR